MSTVDRDVVHWLAQMRGELDENQLRQMRDLISEQYPETGAPELQYVYYLSFSHGRGFGCTQLSRLAPITSYEEVKGLCALIAGSGKADGVTILNWVLLRTETAPSA